MLRKPRTAAASRGRKSAVKGTGQKTTRKRAHASRVEPAGKRVPLLPKHNISLVHFEGNAEPFVRCFQEAWRRLPSPVRKCLLGYWRKHAARNSADLPCIALASANAAGQSTYGLGLLFDARMVASMPEAAVCVLVAHELAHVHQEATGWVPVLFPEGAGEDASDEAKEDFGEEADEDVNWRLEEWGFDTRLLYEWSWESGYALRDNPKLAKLFGKDLDSFTRPTRAQKKPR